MKDLNRYETRKQKTLPSMKYAELKQLDNMTRKQKHMIEIAYEALALSNPENKWFESDITRMADYIDINPFKALDSIVDQFPNVFYPYEFEMKLKEQRKLHFRKLSGIM